MPAMPAATSPASQPSTVATRHGRLTAEERRILLDGFRHGLSAKRILAQLHAAGYTHRRLWCVYRARTRWEERGVVTSGPGRFWSDDEIDMLLEAARADRETFARALANLSRRTTLTVELPELPARARTAGLEAARAAGSHAIRSRWVEPLDKAEREAEVAQELARAGAGLPRQGSAVTLPGFALGRAIGPLIPLADTIVGVEHDPLIFERLVATQVTTPPLPTRIRLVLGDFWRTVQELQDPIRVLDYDGTSAMRPDVLAHLLASLPRLTSPAVMRLTFERQQGAGPDEVLAELGARLRLERVWCAHHRHVRPMTTIVLRVSRPNA
jgi:hypothetical protein